MWGCAGARRTRYFISFARAPRRERGLRGSSPEPNPDMAGIKPRRAKPGPKTEPGFRFQNWPRNPARRTDSGTKNEPGFRSRNWDRDYWVYIRKQISGPDSGPNFGTGIRDHFRTGFRSAGRENRKNPGPIFGRFFAPPSPPPPVLQNRSGLHLFWPRSAPACGSTYGRVRVGKWIIDIGKRAPPFAVKLRPPPLRRQAALTKRKEAIFVEGS